MPRPLGSVQLDVLYALRRNGWYKAGCGWWWQNHSTTMRVLDSLVKRGAVRLDACGVYRPVSAEDLYRPQLSVEQLAVKAAAKQLRDMVGKCGRANDAGLYLAAITLDPGLEEKHVD